MPLLIDGQALADLVAQDGQPRQASADDGSIHMLFLDGAVVRSCLLPDWPAEQLVLAQHAQDRQDALALRARVLALAQSAVGTRVDDLLAGQVKALVAILLWQAGAIDNAGVVLPLAQWVDR